MPNPGRPRAHTKNPFPGMKGPSRRLDRIPHANKVDPSDPDRTNILLALHRMELAGVEIDARAVEIATKLARHDRACRLGEDAESVRERMANQAAWRNPDPNFRLNPGVVYYILKQRLIKIGVTSVPVKRFRDLMPDAILAVEPGDEDIERSRHQQFRELRASTKGEYFFAAPILVSHIRTLRQEHGIPRYPFRSLITPAESTALVTELLA